jgi:hypothetical protein
MKAILVRDFGGNLFFLVIGPGMFFRENKGTAGKTAICTGMHWFYADQAPDELALMINSERSE